MLFHPLLFSLLFTLLSGVKLLLPKNNNGLAQKDHRWWKFRIPTLAM
jgi:hypothetical protein